MPSTIQLILIALLLAATGAIAALPVIYPN